MAHFQQNLPKKIYLEKILSLSFNINDEYLHKSISKSMVDYDLYFES